MKKTYINPNIVVVRLNTSNIIAASAPGAGINTSGSQDADKLDVKTVSDVNVWDDEW